MNWIWSPPRFVYQRTGQAAVSRRCQSVFVFERERGGTRQNTITSGTGYNTWYRLPPAQPRYDPPPPHTHRRPNAVLWLYAAVRMGGMIFLAVIAASRVEITPPRLGAVTIEIRRRNGVQMLRHYIYIIIRYDAANHLQTKKEWKMNNSYSRTNNFDCV